MSSVYVAASALLSRVKEFGQWSIASLLLKSGASGLEIRRELLTELDKPLMQSDGFKNETDLHLVYSAPIPLWKEGRKLNEDIKDVLEEANQLQCDLVKFSLGKYDLRESKLDDLKKLLSFALLRNPNLTITVENDQTSEGGRVDQILEFLIACEKASVPIFLTFDIGNWLFVHDDPHTAASALHPFVRYIHVKHVEMQNGEFITSSIPSHLEGFYQELLMQLPSDVPRCIEFPISEEDVLPYLNHFVKFLSA